METKSILAYEYVDLSTGSGDPDEWPYPDVYRKYLIVGDLADKVLARVGKAEGIVSFTQLEESGGYSEYTQETDYTFTVHVNDEMVYQTENGFNTIEYDMNSLDAAVEREGSYYYSTLYRFNEWLKEGNDGTTE